MRGMRQSRPKMLKLVQLSYESRKIRTADGDGEGWGGVGSVIGETLYEEYKLAKT